MQPPNKVTPAGKKIFLPPFKHDIRDCKKCHLNWSFMVNTVDTNSDACLEYISGTAGSYK